jgi:hypothetical protein
MLQRKDRFALLPVDATQAETPRRASPFPSNSERINEADEVICGVTPEPFYGVGQFYKDFSQTTDKEVRNFLSRSAKGMGR